MKSDLPRSAKPRHTFLSFPFFTSLLSCHSFFPFSLTPFISLYSLSFLLSSLCFFPFHLYHPHPLDSFSSFFGSYRFSSISFFLPLSSLLFVSSHPISSSPLPRVFSVSLFSLLCFIPLFVLVIFLLSPHHLQVISQVFFCPRL